MTDAQLYLAIGVPGCIALMGILVNTSLFIHLSQRISASEAKWDARFAFWMEHLERR